MAVLRRILGIPNLHEASRDGDVKRVKKLLGRGEDPEKREEEHGGTALHFAAQNGHVEVVTLLLEKGARIDAIDHEGRTPLYLASWEDKLNVVRHLIQNGARVNKAQIDNATPLFIASQKGHLNVVTHLIQNGAQVNQADKDGWTPLYMASFLGHLDVVTHLIQNGAQINQAEEDGWTPFHIASYYGHLNVVRYFLENGADIHLTNNVGRTALYYAKDSVKKEIEKLFIKHEKSNTKEIEISEEGVKSEAAEPRSVQTEDPDEETSDFPADVSVLKEDKERLEAQLSSLRVEKEKLECEIEKLKRDRSELSGSSETRTPELNTTGPSSKDIDKIEALERELAQLTETLSKMNLRNAELRMRLKNCSAPASQSPQITIVVPGTIGGSVTINNINTPIEQKNINLGSNSGETTFNRQ